MKQVLFVDSLPGDGLAAQRIRSHAAFAANRRRRLKRGQELGQAFQLRPQSAFMASSGTARSANNHSTSGDSSSDDGSNASATAQVWYGGLLQISRVLELPAPLQLGPDGANYVETMVPKGAYLHIPFNITSVFSSDWVETMANRVLFNAVSAVCQGVMDRYRSHTLPPSRQLLEQKGKAMEILRGHLVDASAKPTDTAVVAVAFLGILEQFHGDVQALALHRKMLGRMVKARGGFDALQYDTRFTICEVELMWALQSGYTVIDYTPKPSSRHRWIKTSSSPEHLIDDTSIPDGFWALAVEGKLSGQIMETIAHIVKVRLAAEGKRYTSAQPVDLRTKRRRFDNYWDAFPYLLVDHSADLSFEDLLELALLQFCSFTVTPLNPCCGTNMASKLKLTSQLPLFAAREAQLCMSEKEAMIWMWFITLYAWRMPCDRLLPEGQAMLLVMWELGLAKEMESWPSLREVLMKFFWTGDFLEFSRVHWTHA